MSTITRLFVPSQLSKIGVLAQRGPERCLAKWTATADYLTDTVDGAGFEIVSLGFEQVCSAVEAGQADFIVTNPSFYVGLELLHSVNRIATLKNLVSDGNNATLETSEIRNTNCEL